MGVFCHIGFAIMEAQKTPEEKDGRKWRWGRSIRRGLIGRANAMVWYKIHFEKQYGEIMCK